MNKTAWLGVGLMVYGVIVLIGAIVACPAKHASVSVSLFIILVGVGFLALGKDIEKSSSFKRRKA